MKPKLLAAAAVAVAVSAAASAQSLRVREYQATEIERLTTDHAVYMNNQCGGEITAGFDWSAFPTDDSLHQHGAAGYCSSVTGAVAEICGSTLGKEAVAASVKSVTCAYGDVAGISLTDGALVVPFTWDTANLQETVANFLRDTL